MAIEKCGRGAGQAGHYGHENFRPGWYNGILEVLGPWSKVHGSQKPQSLDLNWSEHLWMCL